MTSIAPNSAPHSSHYPEFQHKSQHKSQHVPPHYRVATRESEPNLGSENGSVGDCNVAIDITSATPKPPAPDAVFGERIMLELKPLESDRPISIRLRIVLKKLLRDQQFRCIKISGGHDTTDATAAG